MIEFNLAGFQSDKPMPSYRKNQLLHVSLAGICILHSVIACTVYNALG